MPKRKEPELDPKEQFKRFQEAAKDAAVSSTAADRAFSRIATGAKNKKTTPTTSSRQAVKE